MNESVEHRGDRDIIDLSASAAAPVDESRASAPAQTDGQADDIPEAEISRITDDVVAALKSVYDPEIPVDIY